MNRGIQAGLDQHERAHGGRGRLTVGTADIDDRPEEPVDGAQEDSTFHTEDTKFSRSHPFRIVVENGLGIDNQIRHLAVDMAGLMVMMDGETQFFQVGGPGIGMRVRTGASRAFRMCHFGQTAHADATDADKENSFAGRDQGGDRSVVDRLDARKGGQDGCRGPCQIPVTE